MQNWLDLFYLVVFPACSCWLGHPHQLVWVLLQLYYRCPFNLRPIEKSCQSIHWGNRPWCQAALPYRMQVKWTNNNILAIEPIPTGGWRRLLWVQITLLWAGSLSLTPSCQWLWSHQIIWCDRPGRHTCLDNSLQTIALNWQNVIFQPISELIENISACLVVCLDFVHDPVHPWHCHDLDFCWDRWLQNRAPLKFVRRRCPG